MDFESLKERSKKLVAVAEQIKTKLARKELDADSEEMKEIQSVMFNMGMASDFQSLVSKTSGSGKFHTELSKEIERFLLQAMENLGGVVGLIDLYCMYNRARGTDMISPEDLKKASQIMDQTSSNFMLKEYPSGVKTIQSRMFSTDTYYRKMAEVLNKNPGLTLLRLAEHMHINEILIKEHICKALE